MYFEALLMLVGMQDVAEKLHLKPYVHWFEDLVHVLLCV